MNAHLQRFGTAVLTGANRRRLRPRGLSGVLGLGAGNLHVLDPDR